MKNSTFNMPVLSFIVTSYNYANYIEECVNSIIAQTYENIEIIIVDDHSRDNSVDVINNIIIKNNTNRQIKLVKHKSTKGQLASILDGIKESTGTFIACVDSDDKLCPNYAMSHISLHLGMPCALTVCELMVIDENSTITSINSPTNPKLPETELMELKLKYKELETNANIKKLTRKEQFFGGWWWAPMSCGVFRRAAIEPFLKFERTDNWRISPDKLIFNFLHLIGGSIKLYEPLVLYRKHGMNAGVGTQIIGDRRYNSNTARKSYLKNQINLYKDILDFFKTNKEELKELYSTEEFHKMISEIYSSIPKLIGYKLKH